MGSPYSTIKRKVEDAIEAVINSLKGSTLSGRTLHKGASFASLTEDRIEIIAYKADQQRIGGINLGNYTVSVTIALTSHKDTVTRAQHSQACAELCDILQRDDFDAQMNSSVVTDFAVFTASGSQPGWWVESEEDQISDSELRTEYECKCYCKPSG